MTATEWATFLKDGGPYAVIVVLGMVSVFLYRELAKERSARMDDLKSVLPAMQSSAASFQTLERTISTVLELLKREAR